MSTDKLPVKVYEGEPTDVAFLKSLLESAGIDTNATGAFFGAAREVYVRRRDEGPAREILAEFEVRRKRGGDVLPGEWTK